MPLARKTTFALTTSALLFFALLISAPEARADGVVITSGSVFIGGAPFSRNAWRAISFNFAGNNFSASGGTSDGDFTQGINSPCSGGPCQPGTTVFPNSNARLNGLGGATFNGTTTTAWWLTGDSVLSFSGPGVVIPNSTDAIITLTSTFTMTGSVLVHPLDDINHPLIFSTDVSGSGIATLTLQYFPHLGPGGYILSGVRYDFTPIPEPTTLILLGTGLAGLAARRRRQKKS